LEILMIIVWGAVCGFMGGYAYQILFMSKKRTPEYVRIFIPHPPNDEGCLGEVIWAISTSSEGEYVLANDPVNTRFKWGDRVLCQKTDEHTYPVVVIKV